MSFFGYEWANPLAFILIFLLPIFLILQKMFFSSRGLSLSLYTQNTEKKKTSLFEVLLKSLYILSWSLICLSFARPQTVQDKNTEVTKGIDILFVLDISESMLIEDMIPENRLEASKKTIQEFILSRKNDRMGLVVFSGESYTRMPLTLDKDMLLGSLEEVSTTRKIKMGTAIGVALANGVGRLKNSDAKTRVMVFLTDGENNSGSIDPLTALKLAVKEQVKVYTIGMGKDGQAQLPYYISSLTGKKIKKYRPMHSKVNEKLLKQMADETGGLFYRVKETVALDKVFKEIDRLEKTKIETFNWVDVQEKYKRFLIPGLIFLFIGLMIQSIWGLRVLG